MSARHFRLIVEREAGALERVLGVVRRRRLGVESLAVTAAEDASTWHVSLLTREVPQSEASLAVRQFAALTNVRTARLEEA